MSVCKSFGNLITEKFKVKSGDGKTNRTRLLCVTRYHSNVNIQKGISYFHNYFSPYDTSLETLTMLSITTLQAFTDINLQILLTGLYSIHTFFTALFGRI